MMGFDQMLGATNISASGLTAERYRMEVLAHNIANANTTRTEQGGAFRRQNVVFASVLNERLGHGRPDKTKLGGVEIVGVVDDPSEMPRVHNPGHPDADADGFVTMPNVSLPMEMVSLVTASRAYEANLRVLQSFRQMAEQSLTLARA
jgi:flagellar basal-body rod protein FlgC